MTSKEGLPLKRSAYFDNAKAILIFFVVLGHLLSGFLRENEMIDTVYFVIYLFHMPAFILISGHFSRKIKTWTDVKKMIQTLIIPYILFQLFYTYYYQTVFEDPIEFGLLEPRYALWFLLSMVLWKVLLTIFGTNPWMIVASFVVALGAGYYSEVNEWLSLSRTFFFFPFFLIGYYMNRELFTKIKNKWIVSLAFVLAPVCVAFIHTFGDVRWREWFYGRIPYDEIHHTIFDSALYSRLVIYAFMLCCTFIFLALVPTAKRAYTSIGEKTLGVYLLHLIFIRAFRETEAYVWIQETENYFILILIALCIVYVLSHKWVWKITKPVLTAKLK